MHTYCRAKDEVTVALFAFLPQEYPSSMPGMAMRRVDSISFLAEVEYE